MEGEMDGAEKSKKERVIKAAIKLFSKQGYHDTTVSEIANEAEVAKGTVYWYFDSKEQLFWGIIVSGIEALNQRLITEVRREDRSPREKLKMIVQLHLEFFKNSTEVAKMMQESSVSPSEYLHNEMEKLRNEAVEHIAKVIKLGQEKEEIRSSIDADELANFILGSLFGSYNPHVYQLDNVEEKTEMILNILSQGIVVE
ncbi:MAG: TetR/AcrR family transcriptional regulator [Halanaerobacter sp.]